MLAALWNGNRVDFLFFWRPEVQNLQYCNFASSFLWVWSFVAQLRKESRVRVFDNRVLRKILGLRGSRELESGGNCITGDWMTCGPRLICGTFVFCDVPRINAVIITTLQNDSDNYVSLAAMLFSLSVHLSSTVFIYKYCKVAVLWLAAGKSSDVQNPSSA